MVDAIQNDYGNVRAFAEIDIADGDSRRLGDVILAQLWPLTGERAFGQALVFATGPDVKLPANSYAVPIVKGQGFDQKRVKVDWNPDTALAHQMGGDWTVTSAGTLVTFKSNVGGSQMNFPSGSQLRFIPPVPGVNPVCVIQEPGFTGGTSGIVKSVTQFDDFPNTDAAQASLEGKLGAFPAIVLAWMRSTPVEGRTAGLAQGQTRKGRDVRFYFDNFAMYVIASNSQSGEQRRALALNIKDTVMDLLGDYNRNFDGEYMAFAGTGIEIIDVNRVPRTENTMIIMVTMRTISVRKRVEFRSFNKWREVQYKDFRPADAPANPNTPPLNPEELDVSKPLDPMPQE